MLKPLGDAFIELVKLVIAPVICLTVASGMAQMGDIKAFGRAGIKALLNFQMVSALVLLMGPIVGHVLGPGPGFKLDPDALDPKIA